MTAVEFRRLFADSGLSHQEVATRLEIDPCDILLYEIGALPIPPVVEYAVLWIMNLEQAEVFFAGN